MRAQHADAHIHQLEVEVPGVVAGRKAKCGKVHKAARSLACSTCHLIDDPPAATWPGQADEDTALMFQKQPYRPLSCLGWC